MHKLLPLLFALSFFSVGSLFAQPGGSITKPDALPSVFVLGEHEAAYEKLILNHQTQLLNVADNDMERAFRAWIEMVIAMEKYAEKVDFDINGLRFWIHVFWKEDGSVDHIAFHLRPNSRAVDNQLLGGFLRSFSKQYQLPMTSDVPFSHYTSVAFPSSYMLEDTTQKDKN